MTKYRKLLASTSQTHVTKIIECRRSKESPGYTGIDQKDSKISQFNYSEVEARIIIVLATFLVAVTKYTTLKIELGGKCIS